MSHPSGCNPADLGQGLWETRTLGNKPPGASSQPAFIYLMARAEQAGVSRAKAAASGCSLPLPDPGCSRLLARSRLPAPGCSRHAPSLI